MTKATALFATASGLVLLVACSSPFAPADPADAGDDAATVEGSTSGADGGSGQDAFVSTGDGGSNDASSDGSDAAPACMAPKKPNAATCVVGSDCCSDACATNHTCVDQCKLAAGSCTLGGSDCCVGTYCSTSGFAKCMDCRLNGMPAEVSPISNVVVAESCCSGHADPTSKNCSP